MNSGEKVFGSVVRNFNQAFYDQVVFKSQEATFTYSPNDILGFRLDNGQLFLSGSFPGSEELHFIQIIISGPLILSSYKERFFLSDGNTSEELKAFYQKVQVNDKTYQKYMRPFITPLKLYLTGDCGVALYEEIDRMPFSEMALTRVIKEYLDCQQAAYSVYANETSFVKISPTLGLGFSHFSLASFSGREGRKDRFDNSLGFMGQVGVRFHDFRRLPRFSTEIRLGYSQFATQILSSYESSGLIWTGSEDVKETALYLPLSFNYSILKNQKMEVYFGILGGFWSSKITQENGIADQRFLSTESVYLIEGDITELQDSRFISGLKLGTNLRATSKFRIFAELEATSQSNYYRFALLNDNSEYKRNRIAFQLGIEF